jgi:3-dehydrosphinganine reductase
VRPHALITGGSSGIGYAIARRLIGDMDVSLIARGEARLVEARAALLRENPGAQVVALCADISVREQAQRAVAEASTALGAPKLVVTSAGIAVPGYFGDVPVDVFERTMAVNYLGTVYVAKAAVPLMKSSAAEAASPMKGGGGRIVMISSGAGLIGLFGYTSYSPTKFALRGFAEALHAELRHEGIGISIAYPPDTETPQLIEEEKTKPAETRMMTARAGVWSADAVAERILKGAARGAFAITPGLELTALYRFGSMLAPLVQWSWARDVARMRRAGELAPDK